MMRDNNWSHGDHNRLESVNVHLNVRDVLHNVDSDKNVWQLKVMPTNRVAVIFPVYGNITLH